MSKIVMGALAALFLSAGCATDPYLQDSATLGIRPVRRAGDPMEDGQRQDHGGQPHRRESRELRIGEVDEPARLRGKPHGEAAAGPLNSDG
jgi:hypothetical protein